MDDTININISTIDSDSDTESEQDTEITESEPFSCELCKNVYSSIFSLSNHKRLYHSNKHDDRRCRNKQDNLYYCRFCENKYKHCSTRSKHEKICKSKEKDSIENVLEENSQIRGENEKIRAERDAYKDKIIKLQDKLIKSSRLTTKTFKAVNKFLMERSYMCNNVNSNNQITNSNNNILQICNVGSEDVLSVLTEQQKKQIMNARLKSLDKLVEITHCGKYNQFKNIIITNLKDEFAYKFDSTKGFFVTVKKNNIIQDLIDYRIYNLAEIYDEMENGNKIDATTKRVIQTFMDKCDSEEPYEDSYGIKYPNYKEYKKDCIKILLYNNNEQITKDIATLIQEHDSTSRITAAGI